MNNCRFFLYRVYTSIIIICAFCLHNPVALGAQNMGFHEWLRNSGVQELEIQVNWDSLLDNKNSVKECDALLKFLNGEIEDVILRAEVSVRGKYRRRICEVPPMDIDIKKSEFRRLGLSTKSDEYK